MDRTSEMERQIGAESRRETSKWSDTRERGRQTEMNGEEERQGCGERNLCETCHNKVTSDNRRGREREKKTQDTEILKDVCRQKKR